MSCFVYNLRHIRSTRKTHVCAYCGGEISSGSEAGCEHGIFDGAAFSRYYCSACEPFIYDFWEYMDGEAGDIKADFIDFVSLMHLPHSTLTVEIPCPSCGPVRVMRDDWEEEGWASCPKCSIELESEPSCSLASLDAQKTPSPAGHDSSHQVGEIKPRPEEI